jgi:predicted nucleic acid-binding protein
VIFVDTNVISETMRATPDPMVTAWVAAHDSQIALPSVVIGELAYGIARLGSTARAGRLAAALDMWRQRYAVAIRSFDEDAALRYGHIMAAAADAGHPMSVPDGMIAAIVSSHGGQLATRNVADFVRAGVAVVNPWNWLHARR